MKQLDWWLDAWRYQVRAKDFVKENKNCALFVDMGLGKTVAALTAFKELCDEFRSFHLLVIGPLRVARKVWSDEIATWAHLGGLTVQTIVGTEEDRWRALNTSAAIHTINRENTQWLEAQFLDGKKFIRPWPWDMVILDESHSFKSQSALRWKSLVNLRPHIKRLVQLTGTPSPSGYADLWAQMYLLDGGKRLYDAEAKFMNRWFNPPNAYSYSPTIKEFSQGQIQQRVSDITLTLMAEDYLDLPPVKFNPIRVTLDARALAQYRRMEHKLLIKIDTRTISAVNAGVLMGKCLQLANGAVFYDAKQNWVEFHNEKIKALVELMEGTSGPVMIAYAYRHDLARIKVAVAKFCGKHRTWDVLKTSASEERWAKGETEFLILHPGSAGEGTNLYKSGSQTIIWFGLTANLLHWLQLNGRLTGGQRRLGKHIVIHYIITEGTKDEAMWTLLEAKDGSQTGLMRALALRL